MTGSPSQAPRLATIIVIVLFGLLLRGICLARAPLVGADSHRFLEQAKRLERGDLTHALADPYHPLTALGIAGAHRVLVWVSGEETDPDRERRRREWAAHSVIMLAGLAVVLLTLDLGRRLGPTRSAVPLGFLAAAQPYWVRSSADIMSDSLFLTFFLLALREGLKCGEESRKRTPLVAGLAVGLAYLARPEGLILAVVLPGLWLAGSPLGSGLRRIVLFGTGTAFVVAPYVVALRQAFGVWTLTAKKDLGEVMAAGAGTGPTPGLEPPSVDLLELARHIGKLWTGSSPELLWAAAVVGLVVICRQREWGRGHWTLLAVMGLWLPLLVGVSLLTGDAEYVSRRHVFVLVAMTLPFAARGLETLAAAVSGWFPDRRRPAIRTAVLTLAILALVPKAIAPQRQDQLAQRAAGQAILQESGPGVSIFTGREKVAYYALGRWRNLVHERDPEGVVAAMRAEPRAWLVFYRERVDRVCPGLRSYLETHDTGLRRVKILEETEARPLRHLEVYRWDG